MDVIEPFVNMGPNNYPNIVDVPVNSISKDSYDIVVVAEIQDHRKQQKQYELIKAHGLKSIKTISNEFTFVKIFGK